MAGKRSTFRKHLWPRGHGLRSLREMIVPERIFLWAIAILVGLCVSGCGLINLGKWKGIERTAKDEEYYLVKEIFLTAGSVRSPKENFDHTMHETVNLFFIPRNETNTYTAESIWYDPSGIEFRTIRQTYDRQKEYGKGEEREKAGTMRVHSMPTKELYNHKPGLWKVALYLEGKLVRRLTFFVR